MEQLSIVLLLQVMLLVLQVELVLPPQITMQMLVYQLCRQVEMYMEKLEHVPQLITQMLFLKSFFLQIQVVVQQLQMSTYGSNIINGIQEVLELKLLDLFVQHLLKQQIIKQLNSYYGTKQQLQFVPLLQQLDVKVSQKLVFQKIPVTQILLLKKLLQHQQPLLYSMYILKQLLLVLLQEVKLSIIMEISIQQELIPMFTQLVVP